MGVRVEIRTREQFSPASSAPIRVYSIDDTFTSQELTEVQRLLIDPIAEEGTVNKPVLDTLPFQFPKGAILEVSPKPGVMDPEGMEARRVLEQVLGRPVGEVSFSRQYFWSGESGETREDMQRRISNPVVNQIRTLSPQEWDPKLGFSFYSLQVTLPPIDAFQYVSLALSDAQLLQLSKARLLALNLPEMQAIQSLFQSQQHQDYLQRRQLVKLAAQPTDAEVEAIAQIWSEHCVHKKFKGIWHYISNDPHDESGLPPVVDNLFMSLIVATTEHIARKKKWLVSVFSDNAGVMRLNDEWNISHKVETHNHPSSPSLDPFGGSNTGLGGVLRDPANTGIGMRVVSGQYGYRTPHPHSYSDLPPNLQRPRQTLDGLVSGVQDYGNKMGIPTASGSVMIDDGWLKPAVYVGAVAVAPAVINGRQTHLKEVKSGYLALSLGGRVGKDGIHGATGSSMSLLSSTAAQDQLNQSVQIGNPIVQKEVFELMDILRDEGLVEAAQDCGAGGWNSAVYELAQFSNGVVMDLTHAPEKYAGLAGWEKLISEAQERCVLVIKPENLLRVKELCQYLGVEMINLATFNNSGTYQVLDQGKTIVYLPMEFLQKDLPRMQIIAHWIPPFMSEPFLSEADNFTEDILTLLGQPNMQLYDWIMTRYDHEVQGGSILKPLVGVGRGRSDAIAYHPILSEPEVVLETWGSNPWQGDLDDYHMGRNNVVDAVGKLIAAGGSLDQIAFNGNTTCPKPESDSLVAAKVLRMIKGATDAQLALGTPTISGKDSTSMEFGYLSTVTGEEKVVKAKPELLMSALGIVHDESTITSADLKLPGDLIYVIGETKMELGATDYYQMKKIQGGIVPKTDLKSVMQNYIYMEQAISNGLVHSAQYVHQGGLGFALANSAIAGNLGIEVDLDHLNGNEIVLKAEILLFSGTTGRFVVTIHPSQQQRFEEVMKSVYHRQIGEVTTSPVFHIKYHGKEIVSTTVAALLSQHLGEIRS